MYFEIKRDIRFFYLCLLGILDETHHQLGPNSCIWRAFPHIQCLHLKSLASLFLSRDHNYKLEILCPFHMQNILTKRKRHIWKTNIRKIGKIVNTPSLMFIHWYKALFVVPWYQEEQDCIQMILQWRMKLLYTAIISKEAYIPNLKKYFSNITACFCFKWGPF